MQDPDTQIPSRTPTRQLVVPTHFLAVANSDGYWQKGTNLAEVVTKLRKQLGKPRQTLAPILVFASTCEMEAEFDVYVRVHCVEAGHPLIQLDMGGIK